MVAALGIAFLLIYGRAPSARRPWTNPTRDDLCWHQDDDVVSSQGGQFRVPVTAPVPDTFPDGSCGTLAEFRPSTLIGSRNRFLLWD